MNKLYTIVRCMLHFSLNINTEFFQYAMFQIQEEYSRLCKNDDVENTEENTELQYVDKILALTEEYPDVWTKLEGITDRKFMVSSRIKL